MNIILPLCGIGNRFIEAGFSDPKPLIDVFDKKMIFHVLEKLHFSINDKVFIVYHTSLENFNFSNIIRNKYPNIELIPIYIRTAGAAETVLFGIDHILNNNLSSLSDVLVVDCDTLYNINPCTFLAIQYGKNIKQLVRWQNRSSDTVHLP